MKKILVVLLILAVAGGLFAQGFTLSGSLNTGIGVITPDNGVADDKSDDTYFIIGHDDSGSDTATRVRLNGDYAGENHGVKFILDSRIDVGAAPAYDRVQAAHADIAEGYVWLDLFNDMANVKVGLIDGKAWGTMGPVDSGFDSGLGARLEITPIEGLNFGIMLKAEEDDDFGIHIPKDNDDGVGNFAETFGGLIIGVKYTSDLFDAVLAADLNGDVDFDVMDFSDLGGPAIKGSNDFSMVFGLSVKAVESLTAIIDGKIMFDGNKDDNDEDEGAFILGEKFEYAIASNFRAGLEMKQTFYGKGFDELYGKGTGKDGDDMSGFMALMFKLYGSYDLSDTWTAGLTAEFNAPVVATNFDVDQMDIFTNLAITPKLTFKVSDNATIDIFDKITIPFDGKDVKDNALLNEGRDITNRFQINFSYSF